MTRHAITIDLGGLTLYFSFDKIVGFGTRPADTPGRPTGPVAACFAENIWTNTTGKHIAGFRAATRTTGPGLEFEAFRGRLKAALAAHGLKTPKLDYL